LFAEELVGAKFQRLAKLPAEIPPNAPVIVARVDAAPAPTPLLYKARLASHQPGAMDAGALGIPHELDDGKPTTAWTEDLIRSAGEGQFFTYTARVPGAKAAQIRIVAGTHKGGNRLQRVAVASAQGAWRIDLPDAAKEKNPVAYVADLPSPIDGCVTLVVESTYGPDTGTTSIAELAVFADGERSGTGGEALLARTIAEGKEGALAAAQALAPRGAAAAAALDAELARTTDTGARTRLVRAAIELGDPAAGPLLGRAAVQGFVTGKDLVAAVAALKGLGHGQTLYTLAITAKVPMEARLAAVRAFVPTVDAERGFLVQLAGRGLREQRHAVIEALAAIAIADLVVAAQVATKPAGAGDLWRAVTKRAYATTSERAPALAALTGALPTATDYERRYRIVDGLAALGDTAALASLSTLLAGLPASAETAAFKQIAARAIASNPRAEAFALVVALATDKDPGVRLAALAALASSSGGTAGAWHGPSGADGVDRIMATALATDTWPEVRRHAAQLLGSRCDRVGPARALADSVARDKHLGVRGDALTALVQCKAPGTADVLARLWDDAKAPRELRLRAIDLVAPLGDRTLAQKLIPRFAQWRLAAIESEAALALAQHAAYAIGRTAPPGAAEALVAALDDGAFPEIVAAAAASLGLLGPACPASAKAKLAALVEVDEHQVRVAAARAVTQCGKQ
jgi:hypothetical protein